MVERIVVNPQEVRGLGNVVNDEKTKQDVDVFNSYVTAESDLIDGIRIGVMRMVYNDPNLLFSFNRLEKFLYVNSDEASLGWSSKKLTLDSDNLTIGFDADDKTLYVGTDAPPVVHDYSISFSQDSYTAVGGSATVSCTLLDNGVAVSGATITFTGGTSTVTGTTGSDGVATATVTFAQSGTVTATYDNVSDTATVTVGPSYLFYDDCSTDRSSEYTSIGLTGWRTLSTFDYDSTNHCYNFKTNTSTEGNHGLLIGSNDLLVGNCKLTGKIQFNATSNLQIGLGLHNLSDTSVQITSRALRTNSTISIIRVNPDTNIASGNQTITSSTWYGIEFIRNGNDVSMTLYNDSGTSLKTITGTTSLLSSSNNRPFVFISYQRSLQGKFKEIKVEAL